MKLTPEQEQEFQKALKEFDKKKEQYKTYTWEELNTFEKEGVKGEVCFCRLKLANSMTIECVICGKIQSQYAKAFARRKVTH